MAAITERMVEILTEVGKVKFDDGDIRDTIYTLSYYLGLETEFDGEYLVLQEKNKTVFRKCGMEEEKMFTGNVEELEKYLIACAKEFYSEEEDQEKLNEILEEIERTNSDEDWLLQTAKQYNLLCNEGEDLYTYKADDNSKKGYSKEEI